MKSKALAVLAICTVFLFFHPNTFAQVKFGEAPLNDLKLAVCEADTSAEAMVLNEECSVVYDFIGDNLNVFTYRTLRIKVFKASGLDWANVTIPYIEPVNGSMRESVSGISGYTYNLENGELKKTKLSKEYIFDEQASDGYKQIKIAVPNVKVGSVFEIKYTLISPYYYYLKDLTFQRSIPVRHCQYDVTIPEYFTFSKKMLGYEYVKHTEEGVNITFFIKGDKLSCVGKKMIFEANGLPALKNDGYVWDIDDYRSGASFELAGVQFPQSMYKSFANTWEDIDKQLLDDESFGRQLNYSNLLKDELRDALTPNMTSEQKVEAILKLVRAKVKWNEKDKLYITSVKSALKNGTGSSAEMNALLICLLKDAGLEAFPVVMSLRSNGRLFTYHPSANKLNYFITGLTTGTDTLYMDASSRYGSINVLPTECMVDNARIIQKDKPCCWVDLHKLSKNVRVCTLVTGFKEDGTFGGTMVEQVSGAFSASLCAQFAKTNNEDEFVQKMESDLGVSISDFQLTDCGVKPTKATCTFEDKNISLGDEYIYINPMFFYAKKDSPFKAETRKLPIEFSYPYNQTISVMIQLPEGYDVEELPKSSKLVLDEGNISFTYMAQRQGNLLQFQQRLNLNQTLYPASDYEGIRNMWGAIVEKCSAQIVLKKKAAAGS